MFFSSVIFDIHQTPSRLLLMLEVCTSCQLVQLQEYEFIKDCLPLNQIKHLPVFMLGTRHSLHFIDDIQISLSFIIAKKYNGKSHNPLLFDIPVYNMFISYFSHFTQCGTIRPHNHVLLMILK